MRRRSCFHVLTAAGLPSVVLAEIESVLGALQQCIVALMFHQACVEVQALGADDDATWVPSDDGTHTAIVSLAALMSAPGPPVHRLTNAVRPRVGGVARPALALD